MTTVSPGHQVATSSKRKKEGYTKYTDCFVIACRPDDKKFVRMYTYNHEFKTISRLAEIA